MLQDNSSRTTKGSFGAVQFIQGGKLVEFENVSQASYVFTPEVDKIGLERERGQGMYFFVVQFIN